MGSPFRQYDTILYLIKGLADEYATFYQRLHLMNRTEQTKAENFSLEALRAGDRQEFARLVEAYSNVIYRLGLKCSMTHRMLKMCFRKLSLKHFGT